MNLVSGKKFLFLSLDNFSQALIENHPEFFQVKATKKFPAEISVQIKLRKPVAALGRQEGPFYLLDETGVLLSKTDRPPTLPLIVIKKEINQPLAQKVDDQAIILAAQIINQARLRLLAPQKAELSAKETIKIFFKDGLEVLFSTKKEIDSQLDSLQFIQKRIKMESNQPKKIDLRFNKPVLSQ